MGIAYVYATSQSGSARAEITWGTGPTATVNITSGNLAWRIRGRNPDQNVYLTCNSGVKSGSFDAEDGKEYMFQVADLVNGSWGNAGVNNDKEAANSDKDTSNFITYFDLPSRTFTINEGIGASVSCSEYDGATVYDGETFTVTANTVTGYNKTTFTVSGAKLVSGNTYEVTGNVTITATATLMEYKLSISQDNNSIIAVARTSSPLGGASIGSLSNNAIIYYKDTLKISFSAKTGYDIDTHTVNGASFTSENSHTVNGNVSIYATSKIKMYNLTLNADIGTEITVRRIESPLQGAENTSWFLSDSSEPVVYKNVIYHSDVLEINFESSAEYEITQKLVNQKDFKSGNSHTVTGDVEVVTIAGLTGLVHIYDGTNFVNHLIYIYNGSSWDQYIPWVYDGTNWVICS